MAIRYKILVSHNILADRRRGGEERTSDKCPLIPHTSGRGHVDRASAAKERHMSFLQCKRVGKSVRVMGNAELNLNYCQSHPPIVLNSFSMQPRILHSFVTCADAVMQGAKILYGSASQVESDNFIIEQLA